jgi:MFS family permease
LQVPFSVFKEHTIMQTVPAPAELSASHRERVPTYAWMVLGLLSLVYTLNFLDRTLIYILFPPIKREMLLTDFQLALLGTTSFVIFYTLLGIPFGRLADRVTRKYLIAGGLAVWSVFSGLTGFAGDFWTIFFCRVMVGVGEATLGPAAMSLLSDYFPLSKRATAQSLYSAGIPLGAAAAFFLGGAIAETLSWRWAFYLLGFPGVALAILVLFIKEPERGVQELKTQETSADTDDGGWRRLVSNKTLYLHHIGYAFFAVATNSLSIWVPTFLNRAYGMSLTSIGMMSGTSMLLAGGLATAFGGVIADRFRARISGGRMIFTALAALFCAVLWSIFLWSGTLSVMIVCYFFLAGMGLVWLGPGAADVHDIVGPRLRGLGVGVYFFTVNIIGYGFGPPIIGRLNDMVGVAQNPSAMVYGLLICPVACLVAALLLFAASRSLRATSVKQ